MSQGSGEGAALDVAGMAIESGDHDALRAELAALTEDLTDAERAREARRVEIAHELYERDSQVAGTPEYAAHREMLVRLADDADRAAESAGVAEDKALRALDGARAARELADAARNEAHERLMMFDRDHGATDGSVVL